ncbi:hypothetical protein L210DRAFT_924800 [Boletus edulis BED1]|uniref:Uncharacterized protein n=1 Tax=Boletus edulis BED1 TaxID=1328754 RepID=A0AAD4C801_BOLED|nr:hypothetical protein L210DRAFT_924800 [Boletus edulis BED1]
MSESFWQDVYAKHLQHPDYGYPLRTPEPMSTLPQDYQDNGLQIGDVGIVDSDGQFDVLFNICKRSDNPLHENHGVPANFQPVQHGDVKSSNNAISASPVYSHGIRRILQPENQRSADYEFTTSARAGAILILPQGATSAKLLSPEQFREVAMESAPDWYEFAKKRYGVQQLDRSLYLITGFYKTRSWSLGSFNNPTGATGKIWARRNDSHPNSYPLEFEFPADPHHMDDASGSINQTVFITGFKITFSSWFQQPIVLKVTESETTWSKLVRFFMTCFSRLRSIPGGHKQRTVISKLRR